MQITSSTPSTNSTISSQPGKPGGGSFVDFIRSRVSLMYDHPELDLQVNGAENSGSFAALIGDQIAAKASASDVASGMKSRFLDLVAASKASDDTIFSASATHTMLGPASSEVGNPVDALSASDAKLFHDATGLYLYDGSVLDENGNLAESSDAGGLLFALYDLRTHGAADATGNIYKINGAITAEQLQTYLDAYRNSANASSQDKAVESAIDLLKARQTVSAT